MVKKDLIEDMQEAEMVLKSAIIITDAEKSVKSGAVNVIMDGNKKMIVSTQEDLCNYQKAMNSIYEKILKKEKEISYNFFEKTLIKCIFGESQNLYNKIIDEFSKMEMKDYRFIRPLYGVEMYKKIIKKGNYIFISKNYIRKYIKEHHKINDNNDMLEYICNSEMRNYCYIEVIQKAKDFEKARIKADDMYNNLDNILRFMFGIYDKSMGLGIFNYRADVIGKMFCASSDGLIKTTFGGELYTPARPIQIDVNDWFFSKENGNDSLWNLLNKKGHTEIENRLLRAIQWIGMAINELQQSIAFCQCAFAIECILQDQKGFMTKSITAQISEYAAFIVGDDLESRKEISSLFTELYGIRSSIAHGNNMVSFDDKLDKMIWLSKEIIISFLIKPELQGIDNMDDLRGWIVEMRYK